MLCEADGVMIHSVHDLHSPGVAMIKKFKNHLPVLLFAILFFSIQIHAAPGSAGKHSNGSRAERKFVTLDDAVNKVKKKTNGRILTAETVTEKGERMHRIKVLMPNGNVRVIYIKAE